MSANYKIRGHGRRVRDPFRVQRQIGKARRYSRNSMAW